MVRKELYESVAHDLAEMSFIEIDLLVDALFAKSETLPYTFNRAIHCNLKKREEIARNEMLNMSR
tara:strand:- start:1056 stop:1250 length:195 start_codon:yes stop_codon:yes gene_type:complete